MMRNATRKTIVAWLGSGSGWTASQTDEIVRRIQEWQEAHPDTDEKEQAAAWEAIVAHIDYRLDIAEVADNYQLARDLELIRRTELRAAVWAKCNLGGMTVAEAARITGMNRHTIHEWINGKQK